MTKLKARDPNVVKERMITVAAHGSDRDDLAQGKKGAMIGLFNRTLGGDDNRKLLLAWLFDVRGKMSSKTLDDSQWHALWEWVGFYQDEGEWLTDPRFSVEAMLCLTEAIKAYKLLPPEERDEELFTDEFVAKLVAFAGGVVTTVSDERGNFIEHKAVLDLPEQEEESVVKRDNFTF